MLNSFRSFMKSRVGAFVALGFLVLIAFAFAAADISGNQQFGSVTGGDRVASVGSRKISTADLGQAATSGLDQLKQQDPALSMKAFIAAGGLDQSLDELIDRAAISEFGKAHGIIASDRLVDSELAKIAAFKGPDGKFSENAFRAVLAQRGLNEATVRQDIADGLVARQLLVPAGFGARLPTDVAQRYAALLGERRSGTLALLPAAAFAPPAAPSEADVAAHYAASKSAYIRPERRVLRYAVFDESALPPAPAPTEAEIAARYKAEGARFAAAEFRNLTQLVLPTEAAARAVLAEVNAGKSLDAAAAARGLATAKAGPLARSALASQSGEAIATAVFAGQKGKIAGPVRGALGWALVRVDAIDSRPAKTLDQARAELATELAALKKRAQLSDFTARVEEEFDNGGSLGDVVKELGLALRETEPLTADGRIYGKAETVPADLARIVAAAFAMEREGRPQVAELVAGKQFVVFDVSRITASAPAPLAEIRDQVAADFRLAKGAAAAKDAATRLQARLAKGEDPAKALASLGVAGLPPVDRIDLDRQQLSQLGGRVPPPLALLFAMAQGTTKVLAAPANRGWFVVSLARIVPGDAAKVAPLVEPARRELSQLAGREYAQQLRRAMQTEVGAKKNPAAISAVSRQLSGN